MGCMLSCLACGAASCCVNATCSMCGRAATCTKSTATRGVYVFQFILVAVTAYLFSNWAYKWLEKVPVLAQCTLEDNTSCYGALSVYRICFGLTESTISFVFLIGVQNSTDWRAKINDGWFPVKFLALVGLIVAAFFIPNSFFAVYGWFMVVGAGFFIIIQLVLLIEFAYSWNESWLGKMEDEEMDGTKKWYYMLLTATFSLLLGSIGLTIAMYYVLFGKSGCSLNQFFISFNLILGLIYCVMSIHPKVREGRPSSGLLQSAVIFLYSTYLVWSSLMSEPADGGQHCNPFTFSHGSKAFSLIFGAVFTIVSVVYSTVKAGSSSNELLGTGSAEVEKSPLVSAEGGAVTDEDGNATVPDDETEGTAYNYSFFHLSFALGAMYVCMLLTNWMTITGTQSDGSSVSVDNGEASVWVKIVSSWVTAALYLWALVAPVLLPDREWN